MKVKITKLEINRFFFSGSVALIPDKESGEFDVTEAELGPLQSAETLGVIKIEYLDKESSSEDKEVGPEELHREEVTKLLEEAEAPEVPEETVKQPRRKKKL